MSSNKPTVCCGQDYKDIVNKIKYFGVQSVSTQHPYNLNTSKTVLAAATTQTSFFNLTNNGFLRYQRK